MTASAMLAVKRSGSRLPLRILERLDPRNAVLVVESTFVTNSILVYPCDPDQLQLLVGPELAVDVVGGHAHLAVAFVDQRAFRPRGVPARFGRSFFMVEYLAFVSYDTSDGRRLRGLRLLRSDTTSMFAWIGSRIFTHYRFRLIDLDVTEANGSRRFRSHAAGIDVEIDLADQRHVRLDWRDHWPDFDELSKPRSFNFHRLGRSGSMLIIRGVLKHWSPRPVAVARAQVGLVGELGLTGTARPMAIEVENVDYVWRNGRIDR